MARELIVQRDIKQSVIAVGGYALKLSNRFTIGVPDLGIWLSPFVPFILETKDFGEVTRDFDRQIDTTPKQVDTMRRMSASYGGKVVCGVAVHVIHEGRHKLFGTVFDAKRLRMLDLGPMVPKIKGRYDIYRLMLETGVARI